MSDLVGNPEDRFSQNKAHISFSYSLNFEQLKMLKPSIYIWHLSFKVVSEEIPPLFIYMLMFLDEVALEVLEAFYSLNA